MVSTLEMVVSWRYMTSDIYDDFALEAAARDEFGVALEVDTVIARGIPVGGQAQATLFLSKKKQLYCYIYGHTKLTFGDVKKITARIGVRAELYLPPKGKIRYFEEYGYDKFREVFPGRTHVSDDDVIYYRTLAPYNPALIQVAEVKDGVIYQADSDASTGWRPAVRFAYRRIRMSQ